MAVNRSGNTPAYAGKTKPITRETRRLGKHPRLRGEDLGRLHFGPRVPETPPLTRGRPVGASNRLAAARNTPAYAGKTSAAPTGSLPREKHPRLRGEDSNICEMLTLKNTTYC